MAKSSLRDKVKGMATGTAGRVLKVVGSLTGNRRTKAKGFLARHKGTFDKKKGSLKGLLKR